MMGIHLPHLKASKRTLAEAVDRRYGCWSSRPLHNFASHGADAFRMIGVSLNRLTNKGLTAEEWKRLRLLHI